MTGALGIVGRRFPSVTGTALTGAPVRFPEDLSGAPALLLCAYRRGTQADVDRWAAFATRELGGLAAYEVPIIPSRVWRPLQGWIDGGMRGGVPPGQWARVVTIYEDGAQARAFIGDGGGRRTQVVLLDAVGVVAFHDAGGFTSDAAARLTAAAAALEG
jgi:hypothetical protein